MKIIFPNAITLLNIICGTISIFLSLRQPEFLYISGLFILLGSVFDFFDGFVARMLKAQSEFGKQLDSLSDLVTFGLAPAFIMFNLLDNATTLRALPFLAFIIVGFSAVRLAIFNITNQKYEFQGLPTPAFAIFIAAIPISLQFPQNFAHIFNNLSLNILFHNLVFLVLVTIIFSVLLVSNIKMFSLKFSNFKFSSNKIRYIFIIISVFMIIIFAWSAIPLIILGYILFSVLSSLAVK